MMIMERNEAKKRSYSKPEMTVIKMETEQLMAASGIVGNDFQDGGYYGRESSGSGFDWENTKYDVWD